MRLIRALVLVAAVVTVSGGIHGWLAPPVVAAMQEKQPPQPQQPPSEFVPIDELPPEEQMPAAPMVVAAYAFVWVAFVAYFFTLIKRIRRVENDLRTLEQGRR